MTKIQAAIVKEQGVTFVVACVKSEAMSTNDAAEQARQAFATIQQFADLPIILCRFDSRGRPEYQGRSDIVNFLSKIDPSRIPWREWTID